MSFRALLQRYLPADQDAVTPHVLRTIVGCVRESDGKLGLHALHQALRTQHHLRETLARKGLAKALDQRLVTKTFDPEVLADRYAVTPRGLEWYGEGTGRDGEAIG